MRERVALRSLFETLLVSTHEDINATMVGVDSLIARVIELQHKAERFAAEGTREVVGRGDLIRNQPDGFASELCRVPDCPAIFRRY